MQLISKASKKMAKKDYVPLRMKEIFCNANQLGSISYILSHSFDFVKDVYFLVIFSLIFQNTNLNFGKFYGQIIVLITTSMILPGENSRIIESSILIYLKVHSFKFY